ncbi:hypothetical protein [Nocardioides sp.]|uniref:hypothetical protein n=1 Tax=Nocardioides sp. TaxID=35761 RepID=UPI002B52759F|nr:hypothetical protein [Nocardioides sp.]HVX53750.1 hypothetical protein [Nocardioides sp.]
MASARAVPASHTEPERVEVTPSVGFAWLVEGIRPYLGYLFIAAGLIALFVGWWGVSGNALVAKQLPYIASAGLIGIVLIAIGNRIFLTNDLRRDSGRLDRLEQMVAELHAVLLARTDAVAAAPAASSGGKPFRAVPRGTSYHLPECSMVQGKDTVGISRGEVTSRNLKPCRMCHPDAA